MKMTRMTCIVGNGHSESFVFKRRLHGTVGSEGMFNICGGSLQKETIFLPSCFSAF